METKTCGRCKLSLAIEDFNRGQSYCRNCQKAWYQANKESHLGNVYARKRRIAEEVRPWIYAYLQAHPCVDCGESDPRVLEFDHVRGKKIENVSELVRGYYSLAAVQEEVSKCDIRCANCHRRRTGMVLGHWKHAFVAQVDERPTSNREDASSSLAGGT